MDPLAHTLVGATMAQTKLKRLTPLAAPTLIIAANLPDIDAVAMFLGSDEALYHRRGITHGVVALMILPWLLAWGMHFYDRKIRRRQGSPPSSFKGLLILSYLGVLTHPFLDWLNTYGIRLLMPFSDKWFYGDTLFIVDPWLWLMMAAAVVVATSRAKAAAAGWLALGAAASYLVLSYPLIPTAAKASWLIGIALLILLRFRSPITSLAVANKSLLALAVYLGLMFFGNNRAQNFSRSWLKNYDGSVVEAAMTGPLPANPFLRQIIAATSTHYFGLQVNLLSGHTEKLYEPVEIQPPDEVIRKALEHPDIRGFVGWMRFPHYEVKQHTDSFEVTIRDLRYVYPDHEGSSGIGMVRVRVPHVSL